MSSSYNGAKKKKSSLFHILVVTLFIVAIFFLTLMAFGRYVYKNEPTTYEDRYFITVDNQEISSLSNPS